MTCCTVACAREVECAWVYAKVCRLYRVTRHVALTYGRSMTNGSNYKIGNLHHSPWHSDIRTSHQLNKSGPQFNITDPATLASIHCLSSNRIMT
jgi:hypothetical protein